MAAPLLDINSIMVIGGLHRHVVEGQFGKDLCECTGGRIVAHVPGGTDRCRSVTHIPAEVDAVLVIRDYVGHAASDTSKKAAATKGIPYLAVSRKFSSARQVLEDAGWVKPKAKKKDPVIGANKLTQLAVGIICKVRLEEGRVPSFKEVETKLGKTISSRFSWVSGLYEEACSRSAATTPLKPEDTTISDEENEVYETIPVILESHPDLVLDLEALEARLRKFLGEDREYTANFRPSIRNAVGIVRHKWTNPEIRHKAQLTFLRSIFRRLKEEGASAFLSRTKIRDLMVRIFAHRGTDEDLKTIRVEVFGEWARSMHKSPNAGRKFMEKKWAERGLVRPPPKVKGLVSLGLIENYTVPTGYHSSNQAILNYLDRIKPKAGLRGQSSDEIKGAIDDFLGAPPRKMSPEDIAPEEADTSKIETAIRSEVGYVSEEYERPRKAVVSLDDDVILAIAETIAELLDTNIETRFQAADRTNSSRFTRAYETSSKTFQDLKDQIETRLAPLGQDIRDVKTRMDKLNIQPTIKWAVDQITPKIVQAQSNILGKIRDTNQMILALASKVNEGHVGMDKQHKELEEEIGILQMNQASTEKKLDTIIRMMGDMEVIEPEVPLQGVPIVTTEVGSKVISVEKTAEDGSSKVINLTINL